MWFLMCSSPSDQLIIKEHQPWAPDKNINLEHLIPTAVCLCVCLYLMHCEDLHIASV